MLIIKKGNILEAMENLICHQVNCQGIMGGGLALQIANKYPICETNYKTFCSYDFNDYDKLKGKHCLVEISEDKYIANCFTQKPNFDTDYEALKACFSNLKDNILKINNYKPSICIPYKYGCGIANGSWEQVESILIDIFTDVDIVIYKLD